jgi:hypothetical protein
VALANMRYIIYHRLQGMYHTMKIFKIVVHFRVNIYRNDVTTLMHNVWSWYHYGKVNFIHALYIQVGLFNTWLHGIHIGLTKISIIIVTFAIVRIRLKYELGLQLISYNFSVNVANFVVKFKSS